MSNENVLIIGGLGYIGSYLTYEAVRAGYNVTVLDSLLYGQSPLPRLEARLNQNIF
jgi:nucleoside-diphosphate-sugar epimerase